MSARSGKYKSLYSSTSSSFGTGEAVTITPASVVGLPSTEIVLTFDRVDSAGTATPAKLERIKGTITGANFVVSASGRGYDGTTEQAHTSPVVEMVWNAADWNDHIDANEVEHNANGTHKALVSQALTTPKITTSINDANGNEVIKTPATSSAINEITVTNAASGNAPEISATGGGTDINLKLSAKGTGKLLFDAFYQTPLTYTPDAAGTATLDLSTGNEHRITMPAGNITIAVSNEVSGQKFIVSLLQDSGGSRTVTWFDTIRWAGGSAPTLTATGSKRDVFGFIVTGTDTYDGFVVGQNI